ncbi:MAG: hypothetical protein C4529_08875, partial [Deltaproteobacteria bacterium]
MPNEVVLGIQIRADGSIAVKQIGDVGKSVSRLGEGSRSTFDQLRSHWLAASAAIYGGLRTIQAGWALAQNAAGVSEQIASLNALAARYGTTADQITNRISQVSGGLIGQAAAAEVAAQGLAKNLNPDQIYQLAEAAETLSNVTGKTAADSFRELSAAVAVGRERAMEGSAGAIDLRDRYGELAGMMSEAERRQALFNLVLERSNQLKQDGVGLTDSDADKLERYGNTVAAAKLQVGNFLLQGVVPLAHGLTWGIQVAQEHSTAIKAAALTAGVFAAGYFISAAAAAAELAVNFISAGQAARYLLFSGLNLLMNPLTWIIAAVGGLAYLWIRLGQSTTEARLALDQYRASVVALNAEQRAQELAKQKAYIDELTRYIQRQQEVLAQGPSFNPFDDAINAANLDKAQRWKNDAEERVKMLTVQAPGITPPADTGYSERLKRLEDLDRGYRERKEVAETAEIDQKLLQLNHWYDEQERVLDKLSADQKHYDALNAAYSAEYDKVDYDREAKFADAELEIHRKTQQERLDLSVARGNAELNLEEQRLAESQKMTDLALKAWSAPESDAIRARAAAERASLEMQVKRLNLKELELTWDGEFAGTQAELTALTAERALIQEKINSSKRVEIYELDMRRVELERQITDLVRQQSDMLKANADRLGQAAFSGAEAEQGFASLFSMDLGTDPYRRDFDRWAAAQDLKVMAMEERYQADLERLRKQGLEEAAITERTESQLAAIRNAYRQYDVQYDQMIQQQKASQAMAYMNIVMGTANALLAFSGSNAKAMFIVSKGVAVAMAIVQAHMAAIG